MRQLRRGRRSRSSLMFKSWHIRYSAPGPPPPCPRPPTPPTPDAGHDEWVAQDDDEHACSEGSTDSEAESGKAQYEANVEEEDERLPDDADLDTPVMVSDTDTDSDCGDDEASMPPLRQKNTSRPDRDRGEENVEREEKLDEFKQRWYWVVNTVDSKFVDVYSSVEKGLMFTVRKQRLYKTLQKMDWSAIQAVHVPKHCRCKRQCHQAIPLKATREFRQEVLTKCATEEETTEELISKLRSYGNSYPAAHGTSLVYRVGNTDCCSEFWQHAAGIGKKKMLAIRRQHYDGARRSGKRAGGATYSRKYALAVTFWTSFFKVHCQTPNAKLRLFPHDMTMRVIWEELYPAWHRSMVQNGPEIPKLSFATLMRARGDKQFKDVKKRPKHRHAQCPTCAELNLRQKHGFKTSFEQARYEAERKTHNEVVERWRTLETQLQQTAVHSPHETTVIFYDDTGSIGFPYLGRRSPKNLTRARTFFTPMHMKNYATGTTTYMYYVQNALPKDSNKVLTMLFHECRRIKHSSHRASKARHVIFVADNAQHQKNNDMFMFACELVSRGWYDRVDFLYGPVGHTHNGCDAAHNVLNTSVGNFAAMTIGEHQMNYNRVWTSHAPEAVYTNFQYDWHARYDDDAFVDRLDNFKKTTKAQAVGGFRVRRTQTGGVELLFKMNAADEHWLGETGTAAIDIGGVGAPGFRLMKALPVAQLIIVQPKGNVLKKHKLRDLQGKQMRQCCANHGSPGAVQWNVDVATTGQIPHVSLVHLMQDNQWGSVVTVGLPSTLGVFHKMEPLDELTPDELWGLPVHPEEAQMQRGSEVGALGNQIMSAIGYARVPIKQRPTVQMQTAQLLRLNQLQRSDDAVPESKVSHEEEGKLLRQDEGGHRPNAQWDVGAFYLVNTKGNPYWAVAQVRQEEPELRGGVENVPLEWFIKVMWWDKTGNSKTRFVQDPRAGKDKLDWCLCASVDTELTLTKVKGSRAFQLSKGSCKILEERCKRFCDGANRTYKPVLVRTEERDEERDEDHTSGKHAAQGKKRRNDGEPMDRARRMRLRRTIAYAEEGSSNAEGSTDDATYKPDDQQSSSEEGSSGSED